MKFDNPENITLENIGGGAAVEKFGIELEEVIKNTLDLNYPSIEKRTITLKVSFKPSKDRNYCGVDIQCSSVLAKKNSFETGLYVGKDAEGNPIANTNMLKQSTFADLHTEEKGTVEKLKVAK